MDSQITQDRDDKVLRGIYAERRMSPLDQFTAVEISTFRNVTRDINFDVFLRLSDENVAHVFSKTTGLDYKRLAQYMQKGVRELYIRKEDKALYDAFVAKTAQKIFDDPNTPQEKKIAVLLNMTEQNMAELFTQSNVSESTADSTKTVIKSYVDLMLSNPHSLATLLKLVSHGEYLYYHSIAVAIFSMFIARASGQFNRRMLEIVGMGGFLHDIGSVHLPKELVCATDELTSDQWKEMHEHPKLGLKMLEATPGIPDEVRYIVYQHHEQPSGKGYPNSLHGPVIYYPAKIVAIADSFSALISKRSFRPAYTVDQAIEILKSETGKFDRDLVNILAGVFARQPIGGSKAA
jgi:putative nucleotidyltransferase with HDIG domain